MSFFVTSACSDDGANLGGLAHVRNGSDLTDCFAANSSHQPAGCFILVGPGAAVTAVPSVPRDAVDANPASVAGPRASRPPASLTVAARPRSPRPAATCCGRCQHRPSRRAPGWSSIDPSRIDALSGLASRFRFHQGAASPCAASWGGVHGEPSFVLPTADPSSCRRCTPCTWRTWRIKRFRAGRACARARTRSACARARSWA